MLVLVSPTKTQKSAQGESTRDSLFADKTQDLLSVLQSFSPEDLKKRMKVSDKIAQTVHNNYQSFDESNIAIQCYQGSSFKAMQEDLWTQDDKDYAQEHLHILSALYGLVRPYDSIGFYRLDFLNDFDPKLYPYWTDAVTDYLNTINKPVVSLASQEYTKMIDENKLNQDLIKIDFKESTDKGFVSKSTYAKIARGKATQYIIKNKIKSLESLKEMTFDDYRYNHDLSSKNTLIFSR